MKIMKTDNEIKRIAEQKYHRYYSGYIDEQIQLDRTRHTQIESFVEGYKEALRQGAVIGSYAIVRWYDNNREDIVCTTKEVAEEYVKKYNALKGEEKCFVDTEIWLPLKEA